MKKSLRHNIKYKGISALENALISGLSAPGLVVFGVQEAQRLLDFDKTTLHNLFASLKKKGILVNILRNKYCFKETLLENRFAVATNTLMPSYVSFWSALAFYGFTEQQVNIVQIATTRQFKMVELKEIKIQPITTKPKNFFGYVKTEGFAIASKEKALVDSAINFENAAGLNEFAKCLRNAWEEINKKTFVEFLLKANNKSTNSRIGFLIENLGLSLNKNLLQSICANKSKCFVKLNPSKAKSNKYDKKWSIIINDSIETGALL